MTMICSKYFFYAKLLEVACCQDDERPNFLRVVCYIFLFILITVIGDFIFLIYIILTICVCQ
jgi:hypothetical protein